jgi:hypothetical protein
MSATRWDFEYYYKGETRRLRGHVYAATQVQACSNFKRAFPGAFMVDYPVPTSSGGDSQENIATDSLNS